MDLMQLFRTLVGGEPPEAQAFTRITHTPVSWSDSVPQGVYAQYYPDSHNIEMNQSRLPQVNPNMEEMGNVLRHESVHALLPPASIDGITQYLDAHPAESSTARTNLARFDPDAAEANRGVATEAPAYAVQGFRFGLPSERIITEYLKHMPEPIRQKYLRLLRPGGQ